jgi:hypothetical protein
MLAMGMKKFGPVARKNSDKEDGGRQSAVTSRSWNCDS